MRTKIMVMLGVLALAFLNYGIYQKEQVKAAGETVLLELAPVDPRSLMQGDYMRLRYAIERSVNKPSFDKKRGDMVIRPDAEGIGHFVRIHGDETLAQGEKLLHFHNSYGQFRIVPDSFMFQEGQAEYYRRAKYGVFKFDGQGNHILVGLAGEDRTTLHPAE